MAAFKPINKPPRYVAGISLGTTMAAGMAVFSFLGYFVDQKRGGGPGAGTLIGMFIGFFYCGYEVWKFVRLSNDESSPKGDQKNK